MTVINNQFVESTCKTGLQQGFKRTKGVIREVGDKAIDRLMSSRFAATLMPKSVLEKHTAKIAKQNLEKHLAAPYVTKDFTHCSTTRYFEDITNGMAEELNKVGVSIKGTLKQDLQDAFYSGNYSTYVLIDVNGKEFIYDWTKQRSNLKNNYKVLRELATKMKALKEGKLSVTEYNEFRSKNEIYDIPEKVKYPNDWFTYKHLLTNKSIYKEELEAYKTIKTEPCGW